MIAEAVHESEDLNFDGHLGANVRTHLLLLGRRRRIGRIVVLAAAVPHQIIESRVEGGREPQLGQALLNAFALLADQQQTERIQHVHKVVEFRRRQ